MVEVGELKIKGTLDTDDIERGSTRVNQKMSEVKSNVDSATGTFEGLGLATGRVAGNLMTLGTVGISAMTGLAALSPQVAPAMASIANETRKLSFAMGETLAPLFESIGNDLIPGIGAALDRFKPQVDALVSTGVEGIENIGSALSGEWDKIDNLVPKGAGAAVGIALGAPFGLKGMMLGAVLGAAAGDAMVPDVSEGNEKYEVFGESMTAGDNVGAAWNQRTATVMDPNASSMDMAKADFNLLASGFKAGSNLLFDIIEWTFANMNDKDRSFAGSERGS